MQIIKEKAIVSGPNAITRLKTRAFITSTSILVYGQNNPIKFYFKTYTLTMEINLDKPLIVLDIEATGDQINKDRIVEIGMIKTNPDGSERFTNKELIRRFLFH